MPLAGHDGNMLQQFQQFKISTPMPLAGHDDDFVDIAALVVISTPMPLAGHDGVDGYSYAL